MSWKFVFKYVEFTFNTLEAAASYAAHGGYTFLEWGNAIYFLYYVYGDETTVAFLKTELKSGDLV